jgi:hypothetical protein
MSALTNVEILDRFMKKTEKQGDCLIWKAQISPNGYGYFHLNKKNTLAHRTSYFIFKGDIPKGMCVCHKCDVPSCVNPDHLFLGTHKDNSIDMSLKGRNGAKPKISKDEMDQVFKLYQNGEKQREIAKKYNVSQKSIFRYVRKKIPSKSLRGEGNTNCKFSNQDILDIRKMYIPYKFSCQKIAKKYSVSISTIDKIIRRETWAHV